MNDNVQNEVAIIVVLYKIIAFFVDNYTLKDYLFCIFCMWFFAFIMNLEPQNYQTIMLSFSNVGVVAGSLKQLLDWKIAN